jgi:hypothetical protein
MAAEVGPAGTQANLDAGKSPAQLFADTCGACHRSPRELKQTSLGFLREHYSTGAREAAAMAAYLAAVGSDPRAIRQRRQPALGAGEGAAPAEAAIRPPQPIPAGPDTDRSPEASAALPGRVPPAAVQARPQGAPAVKPRRPSESVEMGKPPAAAASEGAGESAPAQTAASPIPAGGFEE